MLKEMHLFKKEDADKPASERWTAMVVRSGRNLWGVTPYQKLNKSATHSFTTEELAAEYVFPRILSDSKNELILHFGNKDFDKKCDFFECVCDIPKPPPVITTMCWKSEFNELSTDIP